MKILIINSVCGIGSTGRICTDLAADFEKQGHEVKIAYGRGHVPQQYKKYAVPIGSSLDCKLHGFRTRILDEHGFGSKRATKKFLKWADEYLPDMLWIHNIHGYYVNVELLFDWIKMHPQMKVKWTLHDCWAFTGHCAYFTMVDCSQWQKGCIQCVQKKRYPSSLLKDNCRQNYERKKRAFSGIKNMEIITPSQWLADLVKQSYLKEYPVSVQYNKVDTNNFKPTPSNMKTVLGIQNKTVVLGVSNIWDERKGLGDIVQLVQMLDERYAVVLVGLSEKQIKEMPKLIKGMRCVNSFKGDITIYETDEVKTFSLEEAQSEKQKSVMNQIRQENAGRETIRTKNGIAVPVNVENIYREITGTQYEENAHKQAALICIPRTNSVKELAELYTMADFMVNPTYEDNFPTVNLEAIACGTFVITYLTGGSPETLEQKYNTAEGE